MSSDSSLVKELLQKLEEEQRKRQEAERERQEAERERQEEKEKRQDAEAKLQEADVKLQEAELTLRNLTLFESLRLWHDLYSNPKVHNRVILNPTSGLTKPADRFYPAQLRPWATFDQLQRDAFDKIVRAIGSDDRRFPSDRGYTKDQAFMSDLVMYDEDDVSDYEKVAVESQVIMTWKNMSVGMGFRKRPIHSLEATYVAERVTQLALQDIKKPPETPQKIRKVDKICYLMDENGNERDIMVVEYKAAHKLTAPLLLNGLRPLDLTEVIHRAKIPADQQERNREMAETAVASVITQIFDYMIDKGVCYGYLTGGEAYIFLFFEPHDPNTLYYHWTTPPDAPSSDTFQYRASAVGLVASFAMLASEGPRLDQEQYQGARKKLKRWAVNEELLLEQASPISVPSEKVSPEFVGPSTRHDEKQSHRSTRRRLNLTGCREDLARSQQEESSDEDEGGNSLDPSTRGSPHARPQPRPQPKPANRQEQDAGRRSDRREQGKQRAFCTQGCLVGLVRGGPLDWKCSNVWAHREGSRGNQHPTDRLGLVKLLKAQLDKDEDEGLESLHRSGWAGALFRIELILYGYTFVGKGTVVELVGALQHEAHMYEQMEHLQGKAVPVFLGSLDLRRSYRLRGAPVWISHLVLLSWGGEEAWCCKLDPQRLQQETERTLQEVARLGIDQRDVRRSNLLWNSELQRVMLIDFEYGRMGRKALGEVSGNNEETKAGQALKRRERDPDQENGGSLKRVRVVETLDDMLFEGFPSPVALRITTA